MCHQDEQKDSKYVHKGGCRQQKRLNENSATAKAAALNRLTDK